MKKILAAFTVCFMSIMLVACGVQDKQRSESSSSESNGSATVNKTSSSKNGKATADKTTVFKFDHEKYDINEKKIYDVNFEDGSWADTKIKIDKVEVLKTAKDYDYESDEDGNFTLQGFVRVHLAITPARDIDIYPTQGILVLNGNDQHNVDSTENWDGEIASNATKDGWVTVPVKDLANISDLKTVRIKFDAYYDDDTDEDENAEYDYDFTLTLDQ